MWEIRECEFGKGLFATEDIPPLTYIGTYQGKQISREKYLQKRKLLSRDAEHCAEVPDNPNFLYDPTDDKGEILSQYISNTPQYINEPPPSSLNNCCWVFHKWKDFGQTTTLEVWTFREIKKGEQFFIFYGNDYFREYQINRSDEACGLPNHFNFIISSPQNTPKDKFIFEEYPAWLCELISGGEESANDQRGNMMDFWNAGKRAQRYKENPLLLVDKCKDTTLVPFLKELDKILHPPT